MSKIQFFQKDKKKQSMDPNQKMQIQEQEEQQSQIPEDYNKDYVYYIPSKEMGDKFIYPLCEFHSRFANTIRPNNDQNPLYFNTYIRSAKHRIRKFNTHKIHQIPLFTHQLQYYKEKNIFFSQKIKKQKKIASGQCNHLGLQNPYTRSQINENKEMQPTILFPEKQSIIQKSSKLYLQYVGFLYERCELVIKKLAQLPKQETITAYQWNQYPALMVYPETPKMVDKSSENKMKKYYVQLFMCIFVAECLTLALQNGIPIQIVLRSSFGHMLPSVAEMGQSFRINLGLVPLCYIQKVIVVGLKNTKKSFQKLLEIKLSFQEQPYGEYLEKYSEKLTKYTIQYNNQEDKDSQLKITEDKLKKNWKTSWTSMRKFLEQKASGGKAGKCLIAEMLRLYNIDYLIDLIFLEFKKNFQSEEKQKLVANAIFKMISLVDQNKIQKAQFSFNNDQVKKNLKQFGKVEVESKAIETDKQFNTVISTILVGLGMKQIEYEVSPQNSVKKIQELDEIQGNLSDKISLKPLKQLPTIKGQQLSDFYKNIQEGVKKMLINNPKLEKLDAVDKLSSHFSDKDKKLRSYKIMVTSGMGAILMAVLATSAQILKQEKKEVIISNKDDMYYESAVIGEVFDKLKIIGSNDKQKLLAPIVMFDLNYVRTEQKQIPKDKSGIKKLQDLFTDKVQYIILDVTTSSLKQISDQLQQIFLSQKLANLKAVLTVSSGLKLQQLGQDLVQWGEIRIFQRIKNESINNAIIIQDFINQLLQGKEVRKKMQLDEEEFEKVSQKPSYNVFDYLNIPPQINGIRKIFKNAQMTLRIDGMDHFCKGLAQSEKFKQQIYRPSPSEYQFLRRRRVKEEEK